MAHPLEVSVSRVIARPRAQVAAYAADPSHAPDWYANIQSVEWQGPASCEVGARAAFVAVFMGRRLAYTYEIREHVVGARMVMSTQEGPFPMETVYEWEDARAGKTRMTLTNRGRPDGFRAVLAPFMALAMRRAMTKDLAALARKLR